MIKNTSPLAQLPSVDRLLTADITVNIISTFGRTATKKAIRSVLNNVRQELVHSNVAPPTDETLLKQISDLLVQEATPSLKTVFNLTGTVLHTNLGRAALPEEAIAALEEVARKPSNLEYKIATGSRGDRDEHVETRICRLTGAEAATVVNNNAAAIMLILNTFALGKEVPTSRGELIEIGGSFRIPEIMSQSGCKLVEVGTTNRTHLSDFKNAISPKTGLIMKVHTSNYVVEGFTAETSEEELSELCKSAKIPFVVDLGSGSLINLDYFGLPKEPTPMDSLKKGADLVTFSGDKMLGGPQAGIIVGKQNYISEIKKNPMKRALRCGKLTVAALSAVIRLYDNPERLAERLPTLRHLLRPISEIRSMARNLAPQIATALNNFGTVSEIECESQIGSGALPTKNIQSIGLAITPQIKGGAPLAEVADAFRNLPIPVIGRIHDDSYLIDLRCLEDESVFLEQLNELNI